MSERRIDIDRLEIRLKGVSLESARATVGDLGRELMGQLFTPGWAPCGQRAAKVDSLQSGTVHLRSGTPPVELRKTIAGRIAASIKSTAP